MPKNNNIWERIKNGIAELTKVGIVGLFPVGAPIEFFMGITDAMSSIAEKGGKFGDFYGSFYNKTLKGYENLFQGIGEGIADLSMFMGEPIAQVAIAGMDLAAKMNKSESAKKYKIDWDALNDSADSFVDDVMKSILTESPPNSLKAWGRAKGYLTSIIRMQTVSYIIDTLAREGVAVYEGAAGRYLKGLPFADLPPKLLKNLRIEKMYSSIYWSIGLNWLTWVILGAPLRAGISDPLEEYYRHKYRTQRLTGPQIVSLYKKGVLDKDKATELLEWRGFREEAIKWLLAETGTESVSNEKEVTKSEIISAYKEGIIDKQSATNYLKTLNYSDDAINIIISLADAQLEAKPKILARSQLEKAYINNLIEKPEFRKQLKSLGYTDEGIKLIIQTADLKKQPKGLSLTKTDILKAWRHNVIDDTTALKMLEDKGFTEVQAQTIIKANEKLAPKLSKAPGVSELEFAYRKGIISEEEFKARLKDMGYSDEDITLEVAVAKARNVVPSKTLTTSEVLRAFKEGILNPNETASRLLSMGYDADDASILMALYSPK